MSLCIAIMTQKEIAISADSRACREISGEKYAVSDDAQKLHVLNDGKVVFFGGLQITGEKIIVELSKVQETSIDAIMEISKRVVNDFKVQNPNYDAGDTRLTDITVACFEQGRPVIYNFSDFDRFELKKIELKTSFSIITCGSHCRQAQGIACKLYYEGMDMITGVIPMFEFIYSTLVDEEMGGFLHLHVIDGRGAILHHVAKIDDQEPVRRLNTNEDARCVITAENGIQVLDASDGERVKIGDLGSGMYGMYLKNNQGIKTVNISSNGNILNGINEPVTYYIKNTQAYYITTCPNANSNLIIFAKADGVAGSYCYIRYVNPGVLTANCSVATTGSGTSALV